MHKGPVGQAQLLRAATAECPLAHPGPCAAARTVMEKATTQKLRPPNTSRVGFGCLPGRPSATPPSQGTVWESCWNLSMPNLAEAWLHSVEVVLLVVARHQTTEGAENARRGGRVGRKSGDSVPMTSARFGGARQRDNQRCRVVAPAMTFACDGGRMQGAPRGAGKQENDRTQICAWEYRAANGGLLNVLLRWADKADCFNAWLIHGLGWLCLILPAPMLTTARPLPRPA